MKRIFITLCLLFIFQISMPMERVWRLFSQFKGHIQRQSEKQRQEWLKGYISHTQQINRSENQVKLIEKNKLKE